MRIRAFWVLIFLFSPPAEALDGKLQSFIQMCKSDLKSENADNRAIKRLNVDAAGLCVCVGVTLDQIVSDQEAMAMAGKPRSPAFLLKAKASRNYCVNLLVSEKEQSNEQPLPLGSIATSSD